MSAPRLRALVAASALFGCGAVDDEAELGVPPRYPVPECAHLEQRPCDVRMTSCQATLLELTGCLRGEDPGELPEVEVLSEAEVREYLEQAAAEDEEPPVDHYEIALGWLGLVEPGGFSDSTQVDETVELIAGFYDHETKKLVVVDRGDVGERESSSAILVHEFVHMLQDRDSDLSVYFEENVVSYDSYLAAASVVEGEARLHEWRYAASIAGLDPKAIDWDKSFQGMVDASERWILEQPSRYSASYRSFPYAWGSRYMRFVHEGGGLPSILATFAAPPLTTKSLMASETEVVEDEPVAVIAEPAAPGEWTLWDGSALGAWGVFLVLAPRAGIDAARSLALDWRGDRLSVYESASAVPAAATALVWRVEFGDPASAAVLAAHLASELDHSVVKQQDNQVVVAMEDSTLPLEWGFAQ